MVGVVALSLFFFLFSCGWPNTQIKNIYILPQINDFRQWSYTSEISQANKQKNECSMNIPYHVSFIFELNIKIHIYIYIYSSLHDFQCKCV